MLDPIGQRLAESSHRSEARKRAEVAENREASATTTASDSASDSAPAAATDSAPDIDPAPDTIPTQNNLVIQGPSAVRTGVAAILTGALFGLAAVHFGTDLVLAPFCVLFALLVVPRLGFWGKY